MMLKLTLTLAVAMYVGFVIWGVPEEGAISEKRAARAETSLPASAPAVLETNASTRAEVTRGAVALPDAAAIAASAPLPEATPDEPRRIGAPVRISLVQPSIQAAPAAEVPQVEEDDSADATDGLYQVTGTRVNLRSGPSTGNAVVDSLVRGTLVEPIGTPVDGWQELRDVATGTTGFMASRFLEPAG